MKCFVCGSDTPGEVCNQCVRTEKVLLHKEWEYKEGLLIKKVEQMKLDVTSYRITGTGLICGNESGINGRVDAFNHYVGNIVEVKKHPCNGKEAVMVKYVNPTTKMERCIFFLGLADDAGVNNAVNMAKSSLGPTTSAAKPAAAPAAAAPRPMASSPTPAARPAAASPAAGASTAEFEVKIKKLKVLVDSGILTQEEFEKEKAKLLM